MAFDDLYKLNDFLSQIDNKLDSKIICLTFHGDFAITEI
ncbi:hypothetical protein FLA_2174 [Filimonas lacunae]|nr:hypothetical protein FLA_2174 [Filimonas lacunae]